MCMQMEGEEKNNYGFRESMPPRRRLKTICAVSAFFFARSFLNSHTSTRFCIHFEFWLCPKEKQKKYISHRSSNPFGQIFFPAFWILLVRSDTHKTGHTYNRRCEHTHVTRRIICDRIRNPTNAQWPQ